MDLSERYMIYITEQAFLIPSSVTIDFLLKIKVPLLGFFIAYKLEFIKGLSNLFYTEDGLLNLLVLFIVSLIYYTIESLTNVGIAESIFKLKIINKYDIPKNKLLKLLIIRDIIKAFFITNIINSIFIIKNKKLLQNLYDHKFNLITIKFKNLAKKERRSLFLQYFYSSMIMYYSTFFILLVIYTFINPVKALTSSGTATHSTFHFYKFFNYVLRNNINLDVTKYIMGGFSAFIGTFIEIFSSNIYETTIMSSLNLAHGFYSFVKYILPQFFPETLGYVFGISISIVITDIIISFIQSLIGNEKSDYLINRSKLLLYNAGFYLLISILLLVTGALIESSLGIYHL